jgi:hypothetical protein
LSAFIFSAISNLAFPDNTAKFLLLLTVLPLALNTMSFFFVRLLPPTYATIPVDTAHGLSDSQVLHRARSHSDQNQRPVDEPGLTARKSAEASENRVDYHGSAEEAVTQSAETSSLLSKSSGSSPEEYGFRRSSNGQSDEVDVRGLALLKKPEFWQLFSMFGLLTGIGLMNIKYVYLLVKRPVLI